MNKGHWMYMIRFAGLMAFASLLFIDVFGIAPGDTKFNKKQYLLAANEAFKQGSIFSATDLYLEILKHDSTETSVLPNLAQSYFLARDYENASVYFLRAYRADSVKNIMSLYYSALTTKMQGRYEEAIPLFRQFMKSYKEEDAVKMKKWARLELDGCNFAMKEARPDPFVKLKHLGKEVNSNYADLAPALRENVLYFSSIHADTVIWMSSDKSDYNKESLLMKLYTSPVSGDTYGEADQVKMFSEKGKHITNGSFSEDGSKFLYNICDGDGLKNFTCRIYMSEWKDGTWGDGKPLNEEINLKESTNTQPYYAKTSMGDVLYFVSDRAGGKGGLDIWYSLVNKNGEFTTPKNAGNKINTDRDELTPFFDSKTASLYFSSNGWINMGGTDILKSQADASLKFNNNPENLGTPFNSPCNDNYFRFGSNSDEGYLVSNRPGIFSVRGKTCCDDIFTFRYDRRFFVAVKGRVFDDATKELIPAAAVNLSLRSSGTSEADVVIASDTSRLESPYFFNLKPDKYYKVGATKEGYFAASQVFTTQGITRSDTQVIDIYLKKMEKDKAYRLNNIYYDFDKWDLRPESKATLDTLYNILVENPTIIIELSSHTDSRGSDLYNLNLSQKRAESCVNYLIQERGVSKERISAKGYGEGKPLDDCNKYEDCPQDQSGDCACHQLNRRTEFKIIGELDGRLIYENE